MLPAMQSPRILDVGCGPGMPTMELLRISGGEVTGVNTHQPFLDALTERASREGLADRLPRGERPGLAEGRPGSRGTCAFRAGAAEPDGHRATGTSSSSYSARMAESQP